MFVKQLRTATNALSNYLEEVILNHKEIVSSISESEAIPAAKVRKVIKALLDQFGEAIDKGDRLVFPGFVITARTQSAKDADGDKPARPERKFGIFRRREMKQSDVDSVSVE